MSQWQINYFTFNVQDTKSHLVKGVWIWLDISNTNLEHVFMLSSGLLPVDTAATEHGLEKCLICKSSSSSWLKAMVHFLKKKTQMLHQTAALWERAQNLKLKSVREQLTTSVTLIIHYPSLIIHKESLALCRSPLSSHKRWWSSLKF